LGSQSSSFRALEIASKLTTIVFDKTGTTDTLISTQASFYSVPIKHHKKQTDAIKKPKKGSAAC
jgi:high-affinity K+ transport system ATPase subunit B